MGLIIISLIMLVIAIFLIRCNRCTSYWVCIAISITMLISFGSEAIRCRKEFKIIIADYNSLKGIIDNHNSSIEVFRGSCLLNPIQEMNHTINEHRYNCDNFWNGVNYSKEIGDLEYLK